MEISISEASKILNISRNTIKKRILDGELSKTPSGKIETSELFRVFGSSPRPSKLTTHRPYLTSQIDHPQTMPDQSKDITDHPLYKAQMDKVRMLEDSLRKSEERESWQRGQIEKLTDTIKLLEAPKEPAKVSPFARWWKSMF